MCFSCVRGCYVLFTHVKASYINRKHIQSPHTVRLRTALWGIQVCLSSTPRKQINRAQGRVSSKLHLLVCCFNVQICNIQKTHCVKHIFDIVVAEIVAWLLHIHPTGLQ